jgi:hypothetical protein
MLYSSAFFVLSPGPNAIQGGPAYPVGVLPLADRGERVSGKVISAIP